MKMKKRISPMLGIGLLIYVAYTIIDRFIIRISDWLAIPLLLVGIVLIIAGGLKTKEEK